MAGLYFHIPFCKRVCAYCDFYKSVRVDLLPRVVAALGDELMQRRDFLTDRRIRTIYFGGGTPSLCTPEQIGGLIDLARETFDASAVEECTVEVNPDDADRRLFEAYARRGVDRLSIGIQSLDDGELRLMNRRHTARQAVEAVEAARSAGFDNLSLDVIFGVDGFGGDTLRRTLDGILALAPEHVSAYHLTIEPGTSFGRRQARGRLRAVPEGVSEEEFLLVHERLVAAGYEHYEVSNYALPGRRARHNASYWSGEEYLGIGPAAHSYNGRARCWSTRTAECYAAEGAGAFECEQLDERDRYNEYVMTRLRTVEGVDLGELARRFGSARAERFAREAAEVAARSQALVVAAGRASIPPEKFLVSDAVIGTFFE